MKKIIQYDSKQDREEILKENNNLILIEEQNITEGNFLIFSDEPLSEREFVYVNVPQVEFEALEKDNVLLKAQTQSNAERADFQEELIVELATIIYP